MLPPRYTAFSVRCVERLVRVRSIVQPRSPQRFRHASVASVTGHACGTNRLMIMVSVIAPPTFAYHCALKSSNCPLPIHSVPGRSWLTLNEAFTMSTMKAVLSSCTRNSLTNREVSSSVMDECRSHLTMLFSSNLSSELMASTATEPPYVSADICVKVSNHASHNGSWVNVTPSASAEPCAPSRGGTPNMYWLSTCGPCVKRICLQKHSRRPVLPSVRLYSSGNSSGTTSVALVGSRTEAQSTGGNCLSAVRLLSSDQKARPADISTTNTLTRPVTEPRHAEARSESSRFSQMMSEGSGAGSTCRRWPSMRLWRDWRQYRIQWFGKCSRQRT
mmetsp:Transcript_24430/g.84938  ORF Transcript_24430/g.84938 Transcript_24430/m.84938 type:complete len:332 (-) Transcript_24430:480-1475(-)